MYCIHRSIAVLTCTTSLLLLGLPLALYSLGLSGVDGRPQEPLQLASPEQKAAIWKRARRVGMPNVEPDDPYLYAVNVFSAQGQSTPPANREKRSRLARYSIRSKLRL